MPADSRACGYGRRVGGIGGELRVFYKTRGSENVNACGYGRRVGGIGGELFSGTSGITIEKKRNTN